MYFFCRLLNERKIEIMKTNYEKFYEKEQPELVTIQGNELRLYRNNMRLSVSKPSWSNSEGVHMGKTVAVDLAANKGNQDLIDVLLNAVELLKK
jgi:hypothetical protein